MWVSFSHIRSGLEVGILRLLQRREMSSAVGKSFSVWGLCLHVHDMAAVLPCIMYTLQAGGKGKDKGQKKGGQMHLSLSKYSTIPRRFLLMIHLSELCILGTSTYKGI